jgi:hypothetical protein
MFNTYLVILADRKRCRTVWLIIASKNRRVKFPARQQTVSVKYLSVDWSDLL